MSDPVLMEQALVQLLLAYAKGEHNDSHIEWEDVDRAVEIAKDALPGEYESILCDLHDQRELASRKVYRGAADLYDEPPSEAAP